MAPAADVCVVPLDPNVWVDCRLLSAERIDAVDAEYDGAGTCPGRVVDCCSISENVCLCFRRSGSGNRMIEKKGKAREEK